MASPTGSSPAAPCGRGAGRRASRTPSSASGGASRGLTSPTTGRAARSSTTSAGRPSSCGSCAWRMKWWRSPRGSTWTTHLERRTTTPMRGGHRAASGGRQWRRVPCIPPRPTNQWGERARHELAGHGVDCIFVHTRPDARMGLYFVEYGVAPRPVRVLYDRRDSAFARMTEAETDWEPVRRARLVHLTGITPALGEGPRALVRRAMREAAAFAFDVNYRATLWTLADARRFLDEVLPEVRYLFLGESEARTIFDLKGAAEQTLEALARLAPKATLSLQQGEAGSTVLAGGRFYRPRRRFNVQLVDPLGAGDAYVAGFLWAVLGKRELQEAVEIGNAVAALKCSIWGDVALVTPRDVEEVLADGPDVRR